MSKNKKTYAKAFGLKSTLYTNNDVYATEFGKGNDSLLVKKIYSNDKIENLEKSKFDIKSNNQELTISLNNGHSAQYGINNPLRNPKADILGLKPILEKEFFGKEFNDNIHIQIAYCIQDINKILSLYSYNFIYALNSLTRDRDLNENTDIIASLPKNVKFEDYKNEKANNIYNYFEKSYDYLAYYPVFSKLGFKDNKLNHDNSFKRNYNILRVFSFVRNTIAHSDKNQYNMLLTLDKDMPDDLKKLVNAECKTKINNLNNNFIKNSSKNIYIICKILGKSHKDILKDYYNFSVLKSNKNIGINIKRMRETVYSILYSNYNINIYDKKNDSFRQKINMVYDYLIYQFLLNHTAEIVEKLRASLNDTQKEVIYDEYSIKFVKEYKNKIIASNNSDKISKTISDTVKNRIEINGSLNDVKVVDANDISLFAKVIYFVSEVLNRKDQNNLITALINKFDNISTFNDILTDKLKQSPDYKDEYKIFNQACKIANDLRLVKNLTGSVVDMGNISKGLYKDALKSLGVINEDECDKILDNMLNQDEGKHQFRNFLANNIIESNKFEYVIKYLNPINAKKIIECEKLVESVLWELPDSMLQRYEATVIGNKQFNKEEAIYDLKLKLKEFDFNTLNNNKNLIITANKKVKKDDKKGLDCKAKANIEIEKIKALVNLYYTVIYLVIKNLVNINSYFILGFECFERDNRLLNKTLNISKIEECYNHVKNNIDDNSLFLVNKTINYYSKETSGKKKHICKWLIEDKKNYVDCNFNLKFVRNSIIHMNVVTNAYKYLKDFNPILDDLRQKGIPIYYELYCFVMEKYLCDKCDSIDLKNKYNNLLEKYQTYNKDMLKIILFPLAYNIPRYKNLTIRDLFYDDITRNEINNNK